MKNNQDGNAAFSLEHLERESSVGEQIVDDLATRPSYRASSELEGYMFHLKKYPPLKDQEMYDFLFAEYQSGDGQRPRRARDLIVYGNIRLVLSIALRYTGRGLPLLDLLQEGVISLMRAIEKYEPEKGFRFSTYATWWVRQGVTCALRDQRTNTVYRVPAHFQETESLVKRGLGELYLETGRWPSDLKLYEWVKNYDTKAAEKLCLADMIRVRREIESGGSTSRVHLDAPVGEGEETILDLTPAPLKTETVIDARKLLGEYNEALGRIEEAVDALPTRTSMVLRLRLGLGDFEPMTLEEIGQRYDITRERIRQIEAKGFETLQQSMGVTMQQIQEIIRVVEELEGIAHAI